MAFTRCDCLFGAVKLTKNVDPVKYGYSGYDNEFDTCSQCSYSNDTEWGKNFVILVWTIVHQHYANKKRKKIS